MQHGTHHGAGAPPSDAIDVAEVLRGVVRRWPMIMAFTVIALVGAVAFVVTAKDKYTSTAKVIVEDLTTPFTRVQSADRAQSGLQDRDVLSQVEVITSRNLAAEVIDRRISDRTRALLSRKSKSLVPDVLGMVGIRSGVRAMTERDRALAKFNKDLTVYRIERSSVIIIEFESSDAKAAAEVANAVAEAYVQSTQDAQTKPINVARDWLSGQIEDLREKVVKSEVAVEEYRARAGLIVGSSSVKLSNQELSELNSQIIVAAAARTEAEARANSIRELLARTGSVDGASDVLNSAFIQRLREQQVRLRRRLAELSSTYLDNHPRIVGTRRELDDLNKQVRSEVLKIVNGLEQQAKIAAAREASLRDSLQKLKGKASETGVDEVRLRALQREAAANRTLLETFLNRYNDASSREQSTAQPGLARIISNAAVAIVPSFPKRGPIVVLGALAGLMIGIGLAFLMEVMAAASRLHRANAMPVPAGGPQLGPAAAYAPQPTPAVVAAPPVPAAAPAPSPTPFAPAAVAAAPVQAQPAGHSVSPPLASLPPGSGADMAASSAADVLRQPASEYTVGLRTVATWVSGLRQSLGVRRIAFACLPGLETDTAAAAVAAARLLASQDLRVVVVDCDLDRGLVMTAVGGQPRPGLAELIAGTATFSDVIVCDSASPAHIVQTGQAGEQARRHLDAGRMDMVLQALEHAYDLVLVSTGRAEFPAVQQQFALMACNAALILAQSEHAGPAAALCGSLTQAGHKAVQYVAVGDAARTSTAERIAAAVNN